MVVPGLFDRSVRRVLIRYDRVDLNCRQATEEPVVNGKFSWDNATPTPLCFLAVLPELPNFLQYRFVGRDLVLVDIEADLIVDVLPRALPFTPTRDVLYASLRSTK
jgi:hypothetical protein